MSLNVRESCPTACVNGSGWSVWIREELHPAPVVPILRPAEGQHPHRRPGHFKGKHTHTHTHTDAQLSSSRFPGRTVFMLINLRAISSCQILASFASVQEARTYRAFLSVCATCVWTSESRISQQVNCIAAAFFIPNSCACSAWQPMIGTNGNRPQLHP